MIPLPDVTRVPPAVLEVLRTLRAAGKQAFLAGGAVRDLLRAALGQDAPAPQDFDIASDALPEEVQRLFERVILTGAEHGTVTVLLGGAGPGGAGARQVEVTTFRGEGPYLDGRRPSSVTFLGTIEGDLARRDFTVNAIAWDPLVPGPGGLHDPFDGLADLRRHRLRAVGDASARFAEDGLRPLRAVRFACTLRLALVPTTARAIRGALATFDLVARERVRDELQKLLVRGAPASRGLRLLLRTGLLERIAPELLVPWAFAEVPAPLDLEPEAANDPRPVSDALAAKWRSAFRRALRAVDAAPPAFVLRVAALLHGLREALVPGVIQRLKLSRRETDRLLLLLRERALEYAPDWTDGACRRAIARIGPEVLDDLWALRRAISAASGAGPLAHEAQQALEQRWVALLSVDPPLAIGDLAVGGREVIARFGLAPGPALGRLLAGLLDRVLDDPTLNTKEALLRLSSDLLAAFSTGNPQA